ncbi:alpha-1,2-fucosyltransferase [bacterium]|nr:alpha-1,2-fucosyltransferase [bacterium]
MLMSGIGINFDMITSSRIGRYGNLCNSMFQFAAVIGMAKKTGHSFTIPKKESYYEPGYGCTNTSLFDGFKIDVPIYEGGKVKEVEFPFHYEDKYVPDQTDMVGFFQSEKYFEDAEEEIKAQFVIKDELKAQVDDKIKRGIYPDPDTCTSLHLRLGDYQLNRDHHPAQPASYWQDAVSMSGLDNIVVFSDDVEQAKRMFEGNNRVIYAEEQNPFTALYHMSLCRNHIICNSTFGWWGAKLGEWYNPVKKLVIAPKLWFGKAHNLNPKDIIPERWQLL